MVRSARSRSCRATSVASPVSTSFAASSSTSCCAERISPSMMSIASSFRSRSPAMRYQTLSARAWGSMRRIRSDIPAGRKRLQADTGQCTPRDFERRTLTTATCQRANLNMKLPKQGDVSCARTRARWRAKWGCAWTEGAPWRYQTPSPGGIFNSSLACICKLRERSSRVNAGRARITSLGMRWNAG